MGTLITARVWPIVQTTRRYISRYCMQYLQSLEADLAGAAQEEGDGAEELVPASAVEKECDAVACEVFNVNWVSNTQHCSWYFSPSIN
jgi:hypothetical protein